ncbi:MAG: hypothetical protein IPF41_13075 [Flavobacteriales bacterium]|nr:hypothetical protein [Flavobacteriales bacterium]
MTEGNNQENASFPAGICAERTALHHAWAMNPAAVVVAIAVAVPQKWREMRRYRHAAFAGKRCWSRKHGRAQACVCCWRLHRAL